MDGTTQQLGGYWKMRITESMAGTRKEAIQRALDKLGVELHEVEIEILDEGSKGFLGIGQRDVHVRVKAAHLPDDGSEVYEDDNRGNRIDAPEPTRKAPQTPRHVNRGGSNRQGRGGGEKGDRRPKRQQQPHMVRPSKQTRRPRPAERQSPRPSRPKPPRPQRATPIDQEAAETMSKSSAALLEEIIVKMGMEAVVESSISDDDNIVLDVSSESSAILIGRKGRNLEALQFLINRIMLQGDDAETVDRIIVDIEGYVRRRRENLEDMAYSMAKKAKSTNRSIRLKPLDPQERRIVHLTLEDDPEVRTFSLGNSTLRRVVIVPEGAEDDGDYDDNGHESGGRQYDEEDSGSVTAENTQGEPDES